MNIKVPLDVSTAYHSTYERNYDTVTHGTDRLMLFAGDQKIEHLNDDFYGEEISGENATPEHMFKIASTAKIGCFATQLGLLSQYGMDYKDIPYLVKMNSKSHLVKTVLEDPKSKILNPLSQVLRMRDQHNINIVGVGYTIYWGSKFESEMAHEAATLINEAHEHGLLAFVWAYPRGAAVKDEKDPHIIAGAAGATACLGADFVKVNYPKKEGSTSAESLKEAVKAAGRTKLICAGGSAVDPEQFFRTLYDQIHVAGASGNATGRNIHQKPLDEAVRFCNASYAITVEDKTVDEAMKIYQNNS
jgi:fructose-bisphosphate aldolase/6-deoxy-5-ketofructose 1-phosphate synthase